jgi:outer membrane protein OmpA-like peptidoglycan-associated protein
MKNTIWIYVVLMIVSTLIGCEIYDGPSHPAYSGSYHKLLPPDPIVRAKPDTKAEYLQKTFNEIKNALPEAEVVMIEDSIKVLFPNNITYSSKDMLPSSNFREPLASFSKLLLKYRKTNILITGHSDNRGNELKNKSISLVRAKNIKQIIQQNGVSVNRLESWGLGSVSPIADNTTIDGRTQNRRVEFVVLYRD